MKELYPILCLYFWGPAGMTGNNFKEKKVFPLIFMQFWSRSHLILLDWLTPQDVYYIPIIMYQWNAKITYSTNLYSIHDLGVVNVWQIFKLRNELGSKSLNLSPAASYFFQCNAHCTTYIFGPAKSCNFKTLNISWNKTIYHERDIISRPHYL